jgi:DNA-binding SARP family transcriptional activator
MWRLSLLGGFDLRVDGRLANIGQASERLVAYLALLRKPATRSAVAGGLWPDSTEDHAKASLRTALWKLGTYRRSLISTRGHYLGLTAAVWVDLIESDDLARAAIAGQVGDVTDPVQRFGADLLPDWHDEWLEVDRERFRQLRLHALEAVCQRQTDAGRFAAAVDAGLSAVNADPFRESSRCALMRAYLGEGNRRAAKRQFDAFRILLSEELGAEPSTEITRLASDAFS